MQRRQVLTATALSASTVLAGCLTGSESDDGSTDPDTDDSSDSQDDTSTDTTDGDDSTPAGNGEDDATPWPTGLYADYQTTVVEVISDDGTVLGTVTAPIAVSIEQRYLGLSAAESLPSDGGLLFVHDDEAERTFVMREMDFGIDIIYADANGVITEIHHAPAPGPDEDGGEQRYPGWGQYVLETTYRWTEDRGVTVGDRIVFEV